MTKSTGGRPWMYFIPGQASHTKVWARNVACPSRPRGQTLQQASYGEGSRIQPAIKEHPKTWQGSDSLHLRLIEQNNRSTEEEGPTNLARIIGKPAGE